MITWRSAIYEAKDVEMIDKIYNGMAELIKEIMQEQHEEEMGKIEKNTKRDEENKKRLEESEKNRDEKHKKEFISEIEMELIKENISDERLSKRVGCGVKKEEFTVYEKGDKKYCSYECKNEGEDKKEDEKKFNNFSVSDFFALMKKLDAKEIRFDFATNQIIIEFNSGGSKKLNEVNSGLSAEQKQNLESELKSTQKPITFSQISQEVSEGKGKKNDNLGKIIGAVVVVGLIMAIIIVKRIFKRIHSIFTLSRSNPSISDAQVSVDIINDKIKLLKGTSKNSINLLAYQKYFDFLERLDLKEEFTITTTHDDLILSGTSIQPILSNENNRKVIIFCHGLTNNKWSLFYCLHLSLQMGYQVITYDARNHGLSDKSYTSLGQTEARDLQDVID
ncbi:23742_t:CDS:2 [Entrophospora sp. SA101]|nr:23742_t:CDS:2 [Entrophospora sp. SA101]CAJ0829088.1 7932_t:CDS:2 [Entrophospora sp. SA101]CAJ0919133.1 495_t:CDS:2 [Entrophospora sp. SA101]